MFYVVYGGVTLGRNAGCIRSYAGCIT